MQIQLNPFRPTGSPVRPPPPPSRSAPPLQAVSPGATNSLRSALDQLPLSRPEEVDRARALISDAAYPTDQVLNVVAGLLAQNLQ